MNSMICPYCGNLIAYNSYFDAFYCSKCGGFFKQATVMKCNDLNEPLTLDDAIAHLDDTLSDTGRKRSCESCRMEHVQLRAWLAELREIKQERNTPLTLDELRQMDGEPVWVSVSNNWRESGVSEGWCIVRFHSEDDRVRVYVYDTRHGARFFAQQDYGESWLAYRQKPEEGTI